MIDWNWIITRRQWFQGLAGVIASLLAPRIVPSPEPDPIRFANLSELYESVAAGGNPDMIICSRATYHYIKDLLSWDSYPRSGNYIKHPETGWFKRPWAVMKSLPPSRLPM